MLHHSSTIRRVAARAILAAVLAATAVTPWTVPSRAQTAPELDCIWKGTCPNPKAEEDRRRRQAAEEERRRRVEEERRRKAEEDRNRGDEDQRRKAEEDQRRKADEERRRVEEDQRRKAEQDQRRKADDERRRVEEDQRRKAEEDQRRKADEERRRVEEDQRRKAEEDQRRKADDERRRVEEEQRRKAEEDRRRTEEEQRRKAEDDRRRKVEEDRRRAEEDQRRKTEEERRRVEEEQRRKNDEERRRAADRKRLEGELLEALKRGDANDVLLFLNETRDAPNATRAPSGQVNFRDAQAAVCRVDPWTGGPDVSGAVKIVLERHGASRVLNDVGETSCPETRRPYDVVAIERRLFQVATPDQLRVLVNDMLERRLTPLEPGVTAADIAAARQRQAPTTPAERRRQLAPTVNPLAERLVAELRAYIAAEGRTGSVGTEFASFGQWFGQLRSANWMLAVDRYEIDDYGDASGTGTPAPLASVVVYFNLTTASRPTPEGNCMIFAWLEDAASGARRDPAAFNCDDIPQLDSWKRQRGLRSKWR